MPHHEVYSEVIHPDRREIEIKRRTGEPQSGALRIACADCNNGWMSRLQSATKPILLPLIAGEKIVLPRNDMTTLAAWIAMFTMVAEFMDKSGVRIGIPYSDRQWLKAHKTPPPKNWKIWIALYAPEDEPIKWQGLWVHNTIPIRGEEDIPKTSDLGIDFPNTQCTTFVIGKLYVHVFSSMITRIIRKQDMRGEGKMVIPRLWPIRSSPLAWPPVRSITGKEADGVASAVIKRARATPPARPF
jgi:hypothetical protein